MNKLSFSSAAHARRCGINIKTGEVTEKGKQRPARTRRATTPKLRKVRPCIYIETKTEDGTVYEGSNGAWLKVTDKAVIVRVPNPVSTNLMWRASAEQKNVLSRVAREYKYKIFRLIAPLLLAIGWHPLTDLCEARLVVQPPSKSRSYSNKTHPRYDVDNYSKPVLDALKGMQMLFKDDNIFISESVVFAEPVPNGCVWVSCVRLDDRQTDWMHTEVNMDWLGGRV